MNTPKPIYIEDNCPFCGTGIGVIYTILVYPKGHYHTLSCTDCDCSFDKEYQDIEDAIDTWKRRAGAYEV